jgi:hypothetical protein
MNRMWRVWLFVLRSKMCAGSGGLYAVVHLLASQVLIYKGMAVIGEGSTEVERCLLKLGE